MPHATSADRPSHEAPTDSRPSRPRVAFAMQGDRLRAELLPDPLLERLERSAVILDRQVLTSYDTDRARRVLADTDALITGWGAPRVTDELLARAPRLQLVAHAAGTVKALFDPACYARGVAVTTAAQANAWPVAQWTLAMIILAGKRTLPRSRLFVQSKVRPAADFVPHVGNFGLTVGVIGASRIGRLVLDLLREHDYRVLLADPTVSAAEAAALGAELVELDRLMASSDIVTLHAPVLDSTVGMVTADLLASLHDGATFINSARGVLVDHDGLRREAANGRIDVILDVTWPEPLPDDDPLWSMPNVWITPHLAGAQGRELVALGTAAVCEVECLATGRPYRYPVDPELYVRMA